MGIANAIIGALRINLGLDSATIEADSKRASGSLDRFTNRVEKSFLAAAAAVAAAGAAVSLVMKGVIDDADDMGKASQKFGIPVEELTKLRYAAQMSNVEVETLYKGVKSMAQGISDAATGKISPTADAIKGLGIAVRDTDGNMRSQSQVLADLAAKFAAMPDGVEKTNLAIDLFGKKIGPDLIPLLNEGRDGLQRLMEEAKALGITFGSDTARDADAFNDTLDRIKAMAGGLGVQLTVRLLPHLNTLASIFEGFVRDKAKVEGALDGIATGFRWIVQFARLAAVDVENLYRETTALWEFFTKPMSWEETKAAWTNFNVILAENSQRLRDAKAELQSYMQTASLPIVQTGFGAGGNEGWSPVNDNDPAAGGGYGTTDKEDREREKLERKLEMLREYLRTEEESEYESYQKRLAQVQEFENARLLSEQEAAAMRTQVEKDYAEEVARINEQRLNDFASTLGSAGSIIESLTKIMGKEGDKQLGIVKALSLAEALINVYTGITAALRLPFPANIAAAASVAAQGFATIARMKTVSKGSSSGGAASGGGGGQAAAAPQAAESSQVIYLKGFDPDRAYSGEDIRRIITGINKAVGDGAKIRVA
ncbi:hypothetical protein IZ6_07800 [Terrihabitans soli]|uniref:Phage tail tape measure protein n=1 Tax=Terrihabitans soli TaxID=708113 RepID=A0A6S6QQK6_9HYPH|nr:hypothetical protein [Terrihabitans soli]BCJ90045.1 hypothetical protein IZ6_07800 [Terrihabitans soli]